MMTMAATMKMMALIIGTNKGLCDRAHRQLPFFTDFSPDDYDHDHDHIHDHDHDENAHDEKNDDLK